MGGRKKTKIGEFLFEREGKYKPDSEEIAGLKRIDKIDFSGNFHIASKPSKTNMILVCSGDLVISGINVAKGAMGIYYGKEDVTATIHYSSYTFDKSIIDVDYFKRFLKSAEFIRLLQEQVKGGIKTEIKPKHILPLQIVLPDIEEQKEIVDHFKSIETEDSELKDELTHQQSLLKKLRQQILQEAIEGKLTADWRENNPNVEPASELLARIQAEKAQLIKDKKIKKQKPLPVITEEEKPFALPDGWVWCRLGDLCDFITKGTTPPASELLKDEEIPYLKVYNIVKQKIDFHYKPQFIRREVHENLLARSRVYPNDVLMNIVGPPLGKVAIVPHDYQEWNINQAIAIFRSIDPKMFKYIYLFLIEGAPVRAVELKGVVGQDNISLTQSRELLMAMPPILEQQAIVTKVEKLLALCDQLETQTTHNQAHAEQLMQAVLKEAFTANTDQNNKPAQQVGANA